MTTPRRTPIEVKRLAEGLSIVWSDGARGSITARILRTNCPCAGCRESRGDTSHAKPLTAKSSMLKIVTSSSQEENRLVAIWPVGQYALGVEWGDGHNTGIYTYELLAKLAEGS